MIVEYVLQERIKIKYLFGVLKIGVVNDNEVQFEGGVISFDFAKKIIAINSENLRLAAGYIIESNKKTVPFLGEISADGYGVSFSKRNLGLIIQMEVVKNGQIWKTCFNPDELVYELDELFKIVVDRYGEKVLLTVNSDCANLALIVGFICFMYHFKYWNSICGA